MELNIALVLGFIFWCIISVVLIVVQHLTIKDQRTTITRYHKLWKKEKEKFISLIAHLKALAIIGERDDVS